MISTVELFAGIGGLGLAFESAGCENIFATDSDKYCKLTFDANNPHRDMVLGDIADTISLVPSHDILLAGFPCQPFSVMGERKGFQDVQGRGNLFFYLVDAIQSHLPHAFVLENVRNLITHDDKKTMVTIMNTLCSVGYHVNWRVLSSHKHGNIPQMRERVFIVGFKDESMCEQFQFPTEIPLTVKFTDLLEEEVAPHHYYTNESSTIYPHLLKAVIRQDTTYQYRRVGVVRENKSNMCPTLLSSFGCGGNTVPIIKDKTGGIRKLTVRECFRLQGYPDRFNLPSSVSQTQLYKQIGNSVTVPVVQKLAVSIFGLLMM